MCPSKTGLTSKICLGLGVALVWAAAAGCNQYSSPAVQKNGVTGSDLNAPGNGVTERSTNALISQDYPSETTGSLGGSPTGTSSAQTAPTSSNGVR